MKLENLDGRKAAMLEKPLEKVEWVKHYKNWVINNSSKPIIFLPKDILPKKAMEKLLKVIDLKKLSDEETALEIVKQLSEYKIRFVHGYIISEDGEIIENVCWNSIIHRRYGESHFYYRNQMEYDKKKRYALISYTINDIKTLEKIYGIIPPISQIYNEINYILNLEITSLPKDKKEINQQLIVKLFQETNRSKDFKEWVKNQEIKQATFRNVFARNELPKEIFDHLYKIMCTKLVYQKKSTAVWITEIANKKFPELKIKCVEGIAVHKGKLKQNVRWNKYIHNGQEIHFFFYSFPCNFETDLFEITSYTPNQIENILKENPENIPPIYKIYKQLKTSKNQKP